MMYRITILDDDYDRAARILNGYGRETVETPGVWECSMLPVEVERLSGLVQVFAVRVPEPADWAAIEGEEVLERDGDYYRCPECGRWVECVYFDISERMCDRCIGERDEYAAAIEGEEVRR